MSKINVEPQKVDVYGFSSIFETTYSATYAQVLFGSPHKNCAGSGICKTIMPVQQQDWAGSPLLACDWAAAIIEYRQPDVLNFYFEQASLSKEIRKKHFDQHQFLVESPFVFTPPNAAYSFRIAPGIYSVESDGTYVKIAFLRGDKKTYRRIKTVASSQFP